MQFTDSDHRNLSRRLAVLAFGCSLLIVAFSGCRTLDRSYPDSAMLVVQLKIQSRLVNRLLPDPVLSIRLASDGNSRPIAARHWDDGTYLFPDIAPGRYRLFDLVIPATGGGIVTDKWGRAQGERATTVELEGEAVALSETEALPGIVTFMGDYTLSVSGPRNHNITGARTPEGETRALHRILEGWSGGWPDQVRLQMQSAY